MSFCPSSSSLPCSRWVSFWNLIYSGTCEFFQTLLLPFTSFSSLPHRLATWRMTASNWARQLPKCEDAPQIPTTAWRRSQRAALSGIFQLFHSFRLKEFHGAFLPFTYQGHLDTRRTQLRISTHCDGTGAAHSPTFARVQNDPDRTTAQR